MVNLVYNAASAFLGIAGHRRKALFKLQPSGGDYTSAANDSDVNPTTGVTSAYALGVVQVDPATGLAVTPGKPAGVTPLGYFQGTAAAASSLATIIGQAIPAGATYAVITPESQTVRWRDDGTNPTATVGYPLTAGQQLTYSGPLASLKLIQAAATATINIAFYK